MVFAPGELLGIIIAMGTTPFGGPDRVPVHDGGAGCQFALAVPPLSATQDAMERSYCAGLSACGPSPRRGPAAVWAYWTSDVNQCFGAADALHKVTADELLLV